MLTDRSGGGDGWVGGCVGAKGEQTHPDIDAV